MKPKAVVTIFSLVIVGIFIALFILWFYTSGPVWERTETIYSGKYVGMNNTYIFLEDSNKTRIYVQRDLVNNPELLSFDKMVEVRKIEEWKRGSSERITRVEVIIK